MTFPAVYPSFPSRLALQTQHFMPFLARAPGASIRRQHVSTPWRTVPGAFVKHKHHGLEAPWSPCADFQCFPVSPARTGEPRPWVVRQSAPLRAQSHVCGRMDSRFRRSLSINVKCIPEVCESYPEGMETLSKFGLTAICQDWNIRRPSGGIRGAPLLFSSI